MSTLTNYMSNASIRKSGQRTEKMNIDLFLVGLWITLLFLGLIMVGSSSVFKADKELGQAFYYFWRQTAYTGIGILAAFLVFKIPTDTWRNSGPLLIMASIVLLLLVFIPGIGYKANGSARWLSLGIIKLQPSEFVKLFSIIYLSGYLVRHNDAVRTSISGFLRPFAILMVLVSLILLEPDFGAATVMLCTAVAMMWLGGVRFGQFLLVMLLISASLALLIYLAEYRMHRLTAFLDPWDDAFGKGFQLVQSLIAFGRGDFFGVGLGASVQKLFYLPEAHTDFVLAILGEELGFVGVVTVIGLFSAFILRAVRIGRMAEYHERPFAGYIAYGLAIWIALQAFINMGVNMGVLPTKGLTLPFMSYGGSSIVVMCIAVGLLLRIDFETRKELFFTKTGKRKRRV